MIDGILVVDKPAGMTSHDVVDVVRKRFKTRRVGHGGTLDPNATGILIVGIGKATRLLSYTQAGTKRYAASARFGITTTTQDASGEVVMERACELTRDEVLAATAEFLGEIKQVPPMVSAVKVGGERLYRKARRGEEVERAPRAVRVDRFDVTALDLEDLTASFDVVCSGGTYVRTLVHDLGERLGCGAHLTALRRTEAGGFTAADATELDEISEADVRPISAAVRQLPAAEVDAAAAESIAHGRPLPVAELDLPQGGPVAMMRGEDLLAVYRVADDRVVPERVVPH